MRISDWSSDVCSSDLADLGEGGFGDVERLAKSLMQRRQPVEQTLRAAELVVGTVLAAVQQLLRLRTFFKQSARMCELAILGFDPVEFIIAKRQCIAFADLQLKQFELRWIAAVGCPRR